MDDRTQQSHQILLVEDSKSINRVLVNLLKTKGFNARGAYDGNEALAIIAEWKPDVIVSDFEMPGLNGHDLCRKLKNCETTKAIPIIMLTSKDDPQSIVAGINAGADDYLSKSIAMEVLEVKIKAMLRLNSLRHQVADLNRLEMLKEIIITYNHQFNNPLAILYGFADKIGKSTLEKDQEIKLKIFSQLDRLKSLVEKITSIEQKSATKTPETEDYTAGNKMLKLS